MYDTHIIVIFSVSIYHVYLSPILFSPYPEKKNWRKKILEKILLSNAVNHHEGGGHIFFVFFQHFTCSTKHCALHIVVLNEYLVKNDLGRGTKVFTSLFLWSSLNLESFFFMEAAMCVEHLLHICFHYLLFIPHKQWTGKVKPLSPFTIWTLLWEIIWDSMAFQRQKVLKSPMVSPNFIYVWISTSWAKVQNAAGSTRQARVHVRGWALCFVYTRVL